jgi:ATP-dependent helicase HrpB
MTYLPIDLVLPELKEKLRSMKHVVLAAPPGAGKTTRIPLALLDEPWLAGRRILILEPRRMAARAAAHFMASSIGEQAGETVGYRVRLDTRVGPRTRIEVITEGVLTRLLQADPALEDVGLVIFDEFHERSLHADLGLALCLQSQSILREDLRIVVMSATLDVKSVASLLFDAPIVSSEGRAFPIATRYLARSVEGRIEPAVVRTILAALEGEVGDILVFLPGAGEIRRVETMLSENSMAPNVRIAPLYGSLPPDVQDRAIAAGSPGERKIVLATSIAETSLTVHGIRIVIDSGLARVPRFSPRTGMTRLETVRVSLASADQRRGRAGRLGPGVCYRLWPEHDNRQLAPHSTPEILEADLMPLALELAAWGVSEPAELRWIDPPPQAAFAQARGLLSELHALDDSGTISEHGRAMAELGLHPRLAHMVLKAIPLGFGGLACELAAILSERDFIAGERHLHPDADIRLRVEAIREVAEAEKRSADMGARRRILVEAIHWKKALGIADSNASDIDACGLLLSYAYPERIAQQRSAGRFLLRNGRGAVFPGLQPLSTEPYLVAADLDDKDAESRIWLAAPLDMKLLRLYLAEQIEKETVIEWDRTAQAVRARQRERLGAIILDEFPLSDPDPGAMVNALLQGLTEEGMGSMLPWTRTARQLRQRIHFMHLSDPESWPDMSDETLSATLEDWLAPHLYSLKSRNELQRLNLTSILESSLSWEQRRKLNEYAPTHIAVPSGSRIPVDYNDPTSPALFVRLQELFGLKETPRIANGKVPLTLHLLSPAQRPVQVTRDLSSFWRDAYFEVKKDLKGRYPKHYWPDDPLSAMPTNRTKPKM